MFCKKNLWGFSTIANYVGPKRSWELEQSKEQKPTIDTIRMREMERSAIAAAGATPTASGSYPPSGIQPRTIHNTSLWTPSGGSGGGQGSGGGNGSGGNNDFWDDKPWKGSPYEPTTAQVFRILAYDHRANTLSPDKDYYKQGAGIPLDREVILRAPPPEVAYQIERGIQSALQKDPKQRREQKLEIEVAMYFGPSVIGYGQEYPMSGTNKMQEIDVRTDTYLIEATYKPGGKFKQINRYFSINALESQVILFAPKYQNKAAVKHIEATGAHVIHSFDDLTALVKRLTLD